MCSGSLNVVKLFADRETEKDYQIYMEYCDKSGYLADKILERTNPVNDNEKLMSYAYDILNGLNYIHQQGVIHADIKTENVLT